MSMSSNPLRQSYSQGTTPFTLPVATLQILRGWARYKTRPIAVPVFLIGSGMECDLVLGDLQFPEVYCYVFLDASGVSIRWLGKGPELLLDDQPVQSAELTAGCVIQMGCYEFGLSISPPAAVDSNPLLQSPGKTQSPCEFEIVSVVEAEGETDTTCGTLSDDEFVTQITFDGSDEVVATGTPKLDFHSLDFHSLDLHSLNLHSLNLHSLNLPSDDGRRATEKLLEDIEAGMCIGEREQVRNLLRDVRRIVGENVDLRLYVEPEISSPGSY
ncbi:MAG: hypothetical protein ACI9HK_004949 [Pirellulaceae bacterium]|jgi:hypothetical protein